MSNKKILLSEFGDKKTFVEADGQDSFIIHEQQNVDPVFKAASIMADQTPSKEFRHVAYVPDVVMNRAFREGWFHDETAWKRWLNDSQNKKFRTWPGRI